jgi:2-dehydro-3-deoxygalactonokinase
MSELAKADWIAVDWGTSNLRAYAMQGARMLAKATSGEGMGKLAKGDFEPTLLRLISEWGLDGLPIVACGMVGARQGWVEAPYRKTPCAPLAPDLIEAPCAHGHRVHIVPGLSQDAPADVMRGEETQIAGYLALNPGWDGILVMPGTHTKWVHLSAGEVVSFQTFMSGELFALLSETSVLRHTIAQDGWQEATFQEAVADAISKPERLAARLFSLRAASLLHGQSAEAARAALSGLLIGVELAAAKPYWLGQNIAILGTHTQARAYQSALALQGAQARLVEAEATTLAGLTAAHLSLKETT